MKYLFLYCCFLVLNVHAVFSQQRVKLIDKHATNETKILYQNLKSLSANHILFGHQHATEYGHGWQGDTDRSDVKSVTGSHPAVIGIDFSGISGGTEEQTKKEKLRLQKIITDTYNRRGIVTAAWHFNNPVSAGGFYWKDSVSKPAVKFIIPGGSHHEVYKKILTDIADIAKNSKGKNGEPVPIIFRPYHEFDGYWFWWGKPYCSKEEFITLWKFTVGYLRDSLQVHNFMYAFSTDNLFNSTAEYLDRYPGDKWVDILGMDNYGDWGRDGKYDLKAGIKKLQIISTYAIKHNKVAAFTETGLESIPEKSWWTNTLLASIRKARVQLAYVLVWRNDATSATHYYAPFPGQESEQDFIKFYKDPYTLFENDLPELYKKSILKK